MIKKPADVLVSELSIIHNEIENVLQDYLNDYADYGWDSLCMDFTNIGAAIDAVSTQLKYAKIYDGERQW